MFFFNYFYHHRKIDLTSENQNILLRIQYLTKLTMNQILKKLFKEFHDLKKIFD